MTALSFGVGFSPYGNLTCFPWTDPQACRDLGLMPGAAQLWGLKDGCSALLFHTTSEEAKEAILQSGPKPSPAIEVGGHPGLGVPGRSMPSGFWASSRPTVPNDSDVWMPAVAAAPWCVLALQVPRSILKARYVYEPTWPVAQFCLQLSDIQGIWGLEPEEIPPFIHPDTVQKLANYREEHHLASPYLDAIDAAAAELAKEAGE